MPLYRFTEKPCQVGDAFEGYLVHAIQMRALPSTLIHNASCERLGIPRLPETLHPCLLLTASVEQLRLPGGSPTGHRECHRPLPEGQMPA